MRCGVADFGLLSVNLTQKFKVFGPIFPKMPSFHKYNKTDIIQPLGDLYTWVRLYLMQIVDLKTLEYFLSIPAHDLWYLGPVSSIALMPNIP